LLQIARDFSSGFVKFKNNSYRFYTFDLYGTILAYTIYLLDKDL